MRKLLIRNSISGIIQLVVSALLTFFSIRIFINYLGSEVYGVFAVISLIGNLNVLSNLGLNQSLIVTLSEKGKCITSNLNIITNIILISGFSIPLTLFCFLFSDFTLVKILNIPVIYLYEGKWLYYFLLISNNLLLLSQSFTAILDSQQKIYLTNLFQLVYNFLYNGLLITVIVFHYSLKGVGAVILSTTCFWFALIVYSSLKSWGAISYRGLRYNFLKLAKEQTSLGSKIYLSGLVNFLYEPLTKIIISNYIGIKEVGFFDIALKLRNQIWGLIGKISQPLLPLISQLQDKSKIRLIVHDIEQKTFYIVVPIVAFFIYSTKSIVSIWIGQNIDIITVSAVIMITSFIFFSSTAIPLYIFLVSKGYASKTIILQLCNALTNLFVIILTYRWLGYYSVIAANASAYFISFVAMVYYQNKYLHSKIFDTKEQVLKLTILFAILLIMNQLFTYLILQNIIHIIATFVITLFITIILYRYLRIFKIEDLHRYMGSRNKFSMIAVKLLTR